MFPGILTERFKTLRPTFQFPHNKDHTCVYLPAAYTSAVSNRFTPLSNASVITLSAICKQTDPLSACSSVHLWLEGQDHTWTGKLTQTRMHTNTHITTHTQAHTHMHTSTYTQAHTDRYTLTRVQWLPRQTSGSQRSPRFLSTHEHCDCGSAGGTRLDVTSCSHRGLSRTL